MRDAALPDSDRDVSARGQDMSGWRETAAAAASAQECETLALHTEEMPGPPPPASSQLFLAGLVGRQTVPFALH